jgi:hypothetical protein
MQTHWLFALPQAQTPGGFDDLLAQIRLVLREWKAHGTPVPSEVSGVDGQFIFVKALDLPSGCGVDWMTRAVGDHLSAVGLPPASAATIFYRDPAGEIQTLPFQQIGLALTDGRLGPHTLVYDATCVTHGGPILAPLADTWMRRYLPAAVQA